MFEQNKKKSKLRFNFDSLCWFLDLVLTVSKNLRAELLRKLDVDVICAEVDGISQEQNSHNWLITVL